VGAKIGFLVGEVVGIVVAFIGAGVLGLPVGANIALCIVGGGVVALGALLGAAVIGFAGGAALWATKDRGMDQSL